MKTLKATQKELRKEERFEEAAVLGAASAAAIWSPARAKEEGYPQVPSCTLCGETAPDDHHRVWTCRGLDRNDALIKDSEDLEEKTKQEKDDLPVFWTRGLPPKEWFEVEPPQNCAEERFSEILEEEPIQLDSPEWEGCKPFSDRPRGEFSQDDRWIICAWAIVFVKKEGDVWKLKAAWGKPLEGPVQSAPRAELAAVVAFASGTEGKARLGVDCAYVVEGFEKQRTTAKTTAQTWTCGAPWAAASPKGEAN